MATYNIQSRRGDEGEAGLVSAVRAMQQANIELAILTEAKITDKIYTKNLLDYDIECTPAISKHKGGIALLTRNRSEGAVASFIE